MGWIVAQFDPSGQHRTVVLAASAMQAVLAGQQKEDGKPGSVHCVRLGSAQVEARSKMLWDVCAVVKVARQTAARSSGLDNGLILLPGRRYCEFVASLLNLDMGTLDKAECTCSGNHDI